MALSRLFFSGRAERLWLLGMAYSPDNDNYAIDSIQQLHPKCALVFSPFVTTVTCPTQYTDLGSYGTNLIHHHHHHHHHQSPQPHPRSHAWPTTAGSASGEPSKRAYFKNLPFFQIKNS